MRGEFPYFVTPPSAVYKFPEQLFRQFIMVPAVIGVQIGESFFGALPESRQLGVLLFFQRTAQLLDLSIGFLLQSGVKGKFKLQFNGNKNQITTSWPQTLCVLSNCYR